MAYTLGGLLGEARTILNDVVPIDGTTRYHDADLILAFNDALVQARNKRPDLFLDMGLRNAVPQYSMPGDRDTPFPLDINFYSPFLFYVVGRAELREDTFTEDSRASVLLNKFTSQLLSVQS